MQVVTIPLAGYFTSGYQNMGAFSGSPQTYDVPVGRNLTIESLSAMAAVPKGQSANLRLDVAPTKGGNIVTIYWVPLQFQATYSSNPTNPSTPVCDWRSMHHTV